VSNVENYPNVSANNATVIFRLNVWWSSQLFRSTNQHRHILLATYCLPYFRLPKTPNHHTFTLKMATAILAETLDNSQHSMRLNPESRIYTLTPTSKT
jgi:hypothetical protein